MIELVLSPFGAFRDLPGGRVTLPAGAQEPELRAALLAHFGPDHAALLESSALALNGNILAENTPLESGELALLPPVCGG